MTIEDKTGEKEVCMGEVEADLDRKVARNWREYMVEMRAEKEMFAWVWRELVSRTGKVLAKKMLFSIMTTLVLSVSKPWTLGLVFTALAIKDTAGSTVWCALLAYGATIVIEQLVHRRAMILKELLAGENIRQLDKRVTELFFEKSLGTHIDENNLLNEANIKKGYDRVFQLTMKILWEGIESVLGLVLPFCALWVLDVKVALIVTVMLAFHLLWSVVINRRVMEEAIPIEKNWRQLVSFRLERMDHIEKVKTNFKEDDELGELGRRFEEIIVPDRKLWIWCIEQAFRRGLTDYLLLIGVVVYGALSVWNGEMTIGLLYPLFGWTSSLADNLWRVGHLERDVNLHTPSILAMKEALTMPVGLTFSDSPKFLPKDGPCAVEFKNVSYVYPPQVNSLKKISRPTPILYNVSFRVEPGEKVALIGSSGVGKTTIMRLLLRYMDPTAGEIEVDGVDLGVLDLGSWLTQVGYVPQQPQILDGTLKYNLLYGVSDREKDKISDRDLWDMMRCLQIDFGERLTHGLDTFVGRKGIKLSGGQAQRVMIGAAIMKNPRFMIIDEATSSLDPTTERLVQEGLEGVLTGGRGALIITHRLNTVRRICDKFVMLNGNGGGTGSRVTAIAHSFEELAEKSDNFCSLAKDQGIVL